MTSTRRVAFEVFREILHHGGYSNLVLNKKLRGYGEPDKSFIAALVYGTLEKLITIDYQIKPFIDFKKTPQAVIDILRLGAYQLFYMNGVPDYAACSQTTGLAKSLGLNASLVNGVMRNLARKGLDLPAESGDIDTLSVIFSIPVFVLEKWRSDYGYDVMKELARFAPVGNLTTIWPNPDKTDRKKLAGELERLGAHVSPGPFRDTLRVGFADIAHHALYKEGYYSIQGEGSILASVAAMPPKRSKLLDMCAAPGGKSVYIAKHNNECDITAWDLHAHRVELINANIKRMGCANITAEVQDALVFRQDCEQRFDSVIVDAPCSGLGTIWAKPEIRYRVKREDIGKLAEIQERILANAVRYIKKGGILVYSTCTLSAEENERIIEKLLAQYPGFSLESIPGMPDDVKRAERGGMLTLFPYLFETEGFFYRAFEEIGMKQNLLGRFPEEIEEILRGLDQPAYRAKQVFKWLHAGAGFADMTNVPKDIRRLLDEHYIGNPVVINKKLFSTDGTIKYLFLLPDLNIIEGVLMKYRHGNTVCISSQVGCRMGCRFCASTIGGRARNLDAGEMLGQVVAVNKDAGKAVSNIVVMGSGEPLDNYEELVRFLRLIGHPDGLNVGARNITVSTCGLTDKIYKLARENLRINLALSLHAPNDEIRRKLMPVANRYRLSDCIAALKSYISATGRRVTVEYIMIKGINDSLVNAEELRKLLDGMLCHVNLIPLNAVEGVGFSPSDKGVVNEFYSYLLKNGVSVTVRRELGADISGACGQLRRKNLDTGGLYGYCRSDPHGEDKEQ